MTRNEGMNERINLRELENYIIFGRTEKNDSNVSQDEDKLRQQQQYYSTG